LLPPLLLLLLLLFPRRAGFPLRFQSEPPCDLSVVAVAVAVAEETLAAAQTVPPPCPGGKNHTRVKTGAGAKLDMTPFSLASAIVDN
jgi:hypothetical protein